MKKPDTFPTNTNTIAGHSISWNLISLKIVGHAAPSLETLHSLLTFVDFWDTFPFTFPFPFDASLIWELEIVQHFHLFFVSATSRVRLVDIKMLGFLPIIRSSICYLSHSRSLLDSKLLGTSLGILQLVLVC